MQLTCCDRSQTRRVSQGRAVDQVIRLSAVSDLLSGNRPVAGWTSSDLRGLSDLHVSRKPPARSGPASAWQSRGPSQEQGRAPSPGGLSTGWRSRSRGGMEDSHTEAAVCSGTSPPTRRDALPRGPYRRLRSAWSSMNTAVGHARTLATASTTPGWYACRTAATTSTYKAVM